MTLALVSAFSLIIAQIAPGTTPDVLATILSPLVVFAATAFVKWLFPRLAGKWLVTAIVPILSAVVALIASVVVPGDNFWVAFGVNLAATWVREVISQWQKQPAA